MTDLSLRLKTIATLVPNGARVCDVGTDHAYLPIFLKKSGIAKSVIATDLNEKPLQNAKAHIIDSGLSDISLRLCDGLSAVGEHEADTVIIAGMGGEVIVGILKACEWAKNGNKTFILQPTTSAEVLREFLCKNGFEIESETPVFENGKLYSIIKVKFTGSTCDFPEHFYYTGKIPLTNEGVLYLKKQQKRVYDCFKALENVSQKRDDYLKNKSIYDEITKILTESKNGI
ncbi:MAG: SAM-dependent methyltransferase [Clostridia bacterium]|nr:SAM-dependent methyltransferase [Clostridia bacterium]